MKCKVVLLTAFLLVAIFLTSCKKAGNNGGDETATKNVTPALTDYLKKPLIRL